MILLMQYIYQKYLILHLQKIRIHTTLWMVWNKDMEQKEQVQEKKNYLRSEWQTVTKDSNKIKIFGTRGEYKTDTAGVMDYKYHAYGVAYVHENEDIKLGIRATLGVAYENELGRVANGKNKARVVDTSADWFNIRGEKEDRKGNVKFDLNVGLDNTRVGVTANVGYDTKGENLRGGLGLRVIF